MILHIVHATNGKKKEIARQVGKDNLYQFVMAIDLCAFRYV